MKRERRENRAVKDRSETAKLQSRVRCFLARFAGMQSFLAWCSASGTGTDPGASMALYTSQSRRSLSGNEAGSMLPLDRKDC